MGFMGNRRAGFIVLDGVDGCGKTTQAERLVQRLESLSSQASGAGLASAQNPSQSPSPGPAAPKAVLHLREPGSTAVGEALRELLLSRDHQLSPSVETLLFVAARRQMLDEIVMPALRAGTHVVCERFHPSTYAYQAVAGALSESAVMDLLRQWASAAMPDRIVLLEVDPERAARRRGAASDRIEDQGLAYQKLVAQGYRSYAVLAPNVVSIDGEGSPDEVAERVWAKVSRFFLPAADDAPAAQEPSSVGGRDLA